MRTSNIEAVRRANLGEVLRLVHHGGPRSRAMITAETGLNRSTVADLVGALADAGLVHEQDPVPTRKAGRPSPVVAVREDAVALAIHPEVDAVEVGIVSLGGVVHQRARTPVDRGVSVDDMVNIVAGIIDGWRDTDLAGSNILGAGVAVPGLVRASDGVVRLAPHLGWHDEVIGPKLAKRLGVHVAVGNDASLGAQAERIFGAARDEANVLYLNGGASGIGGGIVISGVAYAGSDGYAGEWGQTRPSLPTGHPHAQTDAVLEDVVNRAALLGALGATDLDDEELAVELERSTAPAVADEVAWQRRVLAATLGNAANVLNPSSIVLGGFLAVLNDQDTDAFQTLIRGHALDAIAERLSVRSAALGPDRLLIGAAEAAFGAVLADPIPEQDV